jgi:hypothetical protein
MKLIMHRCNKVTLMFFHKRKKRTSVSIIKRHDLNDNRSFVIHGLAHNSWRFLMTLKLPIPIQSPTHSPLSRASHESELCSFSRFHIEFSKSFHRVASLILMLRFRWTFLSIKSLERERERERERGARCIVIIMPFAPNLHKQDRVQISPYVPRRFLAN